MTLINDEGVNYARSLPLFLMKAVNLHRAYQASTMALILDEDRHFPKNMLPMHYLVTGSVVSGIAESRVGAIRMLEKLYIHCTHRQPKSYAQLRSPSLVLHCRSVPFLHSSQNQSKEWGGFA